MGNLRQKYTDEEWERLVENVDKKNQHPLTPDECFKTDSPIANLVEALKEDSEYFESWKANMAMAFKDEFDNYEDLSVIDMDELSNNAVENFLRQLIS